MRHLPVTRDHELKGIITDRDIKLLLGPELDYPNPREMTVTRHDRLAGIFTASDACRVLGEWLRERFPRGDDAA